MVRGLPSRTNAARRDWPVVLAGMVRRMSPSPAMTWCTRGNSSVTQLSDVSTVQAQPIKGSVSTKRRNVPPAALAVIAAPVLSPAKVIPAGSPAGVVYIARLHEPH